MLLRQGDAVTTPLMQSPKGTPWRGLTGTLTGQLISELVAFLGNSEKYMDLCGEIGPLTFENVKECFLFEVPQWANQCGKFTNSQL